MTQKPKKPQHKLPRLYVNLPIIASQLLPLDADQWHYVRNVMRLVDGDEMMIFNGVDGEWLASLAYETKKKVALQPVQQTKPQPKPTELVYAFAPLKKGRLDYMIQKATEMGASILQPVLTEYTDNHKIKIEKLAANAIEAAEQCTMLNVPMVQNAVNLDAFIDQYAPTHQIIFCDEHADAQSPIEQLSKLRGQKICVFIGPEGGFSANERDKLLSLDKVVTISLGPRIMRADTAAVAALALVQATIGDW